MHHTEESPGYHSLCRDIAQSQFPAQVHPIRELVCWRSSCSIHKIYHLSWLRDRWGLRHSQPHQVEYSFASVVHHRSGSPPNIALYLHREDQEKSSSQRSIRRDTGRKAGLIWWYRIRKWAPDVHQGRIEVSVSQCKIKIRYKQAIRNWLQGQSYHLRWRSHFHCCSANSNIPS